jgi:hypothetical protein
LKVQHKQIRASDLQFERDLTFDLGGHEGQQSGGMDPYGRVGMSLPPSGPMAMSASWYNRPAAGVPPPVPADSDGGGLTSHAPIASDDSTTSPPVLPTTGGTIPAGADIPQDSDPLSSMEALRQNLPDVGGTATPTVVGEI